MDILTGVQAVKKLKQKNKELKAMNKIQRRFILNLLMKEIDLEKEIESLKDEMTVLFGDGSKPGTLGTITNAAEITEKLNELFSNAEQEKEK